jgi:flagellar basal-body rod protein FlgF
VQDQIRLFEFLDKNQVERIGDGYFRPKTEDVVVELDQFSLKPGYLENSNVNAIEEMVRMIQIYREFEMNQRALRTQDETVDKAVNKVGKVS